MLLRAWKKFEAELVSCSASNCWTPEFKWFIFVSSSTAWVARETQSCRSLGAWSLLLADPWGYERIHVDDLLSGPKSVAIDRGNQVTRKLVEMATLQAAVLRVWLLWRSNGQSNSSWNSRCWNHWNHSNNWHGWCHDDQRDCQEPGGSAVCGVWSQRHDVQHWSAVGRRCNCADLQRCFVNRCKRQARLTRCELNCAHLWVKTPKCFDLVGFVLLSR